MSRSARVVIAVVAIAVLVVVRFQRWLAIGRCLDAGGRWHDTSRSCELAPHG